MQLVGNLFMKIASSSPLFPRNLSFSFLTSKVIRHNSLLTNLFHQNSDCRFSRSSLQCQYTIINKANSRRSNHWKEILSTTRNLMFDLFFWNLHQYNRTVLSPIRLLMYWIVSAECKLKLFSFVTRKTKDYFNDHSMLILILLGEWHLNCGWKRKCKDRVIYACTTNCACWWDDVEGWTCSDGVKKCIWKLGSTAITLHDISHCIHMW